MQYFFGRNRFARVLAVPLALALLMPVVACGGAGAAPPVVKNNSGGTPVESPIGYIYVGGAFPNTDKSAIAGFALNSDGSVQSLAGSPFWMPHPPLATATDPSGHFVFSAFYSELTSQMIAADGSLSAGSNQSGTYLAGFAIPGISLDQSGHTLYAPSDDATNPLSSTRDSTSGRLTFFNVGADGALQNLGSISSGVSGPPVFSPDNLHAYASVCPFLPGQNGGWFAGPPYLQGYVRNSDGSLTASGVKIMAPTNACARALAFSPDGKFLVAGFNFTQTVWTSALGIYAVNSDGSLAPLPASPYSMPTMDIWTVAFDPSGRFLITAGDSGLSTYQFVPGSAPVEVSGSPVPGVTFAAAFVVGGQFVAGIAPASTLDGTGELLVFKFNAGMLTAAPGSPNSLPSAPPGSPYGLAMAPLNLTTVSLGH